MALEPLAERLGVQLAADGETALQGAGRTVAAPEPPEDEPQTTENSAGIEADVERLVATVNSALSGKGNPNHGKDGRFASGPRGTAHAVKSIQEVVDAAQAAGGPQVWTDYASVDADEAKKIEGAKGRDFTGYKHSIDNEIVHKILNKHSTDPRPITKEDFAKLPDYIKGAASHYTQEEDGKLERLIHVVLDNQHKLMVVEEIRTGREKFALKSMYRP